ncbi:hypothetical protein KKD52_12240 [Myxococcota bacterium]|jgi:hypothetical protein|nr:hypothetical protein [Myxococcota bacterium]MBU1511123.1 hypothetical protein [Myxococcota bacterium]PKN27916.1 MAG: hypothetical protein CVU65_00740 [Deltaproteobacteria bacterium HGW-Deltaproteobacteria-22]
MINTWNESLLHEELKRHYCGDAGQTEVPLEGSICDVLCGDGTVVEIQIAQLGKLRKKLDRLLLHHRVKLVHPVARNKFLETRTRGGRLKSRRKSPKHDTVYRVFAELTGLWSLLGHPGLELEVVFADILETRVADGTGSWRRKGVRIEDRSLMQIHGTETFRTLEDWAGLLPASLPDEFTVKELAAAGAGIHAGKMAWTLRKACVLELCGKRGNQFVYRQASRTSTLSARP